MRAGGAPLIAKEIFPTSDQTAENPNTLGRHIPIHTFNKSGRHLEFLMNDIIRGKISAAIIDL